MSRRVLVVCLVAIGALLHLMVNAAAPPQPDKNAKHNSPLYVILKARVYEVEEDFHKKVTKARWLSKADLDELEEQPQQDDRLFALLEKKKPFLIGKTINVDPGKEGTLLTASKSIECLPTLDQLRMGNKTPQTIDESFTLRA